MQKPKNQDSWALMISELRKIVYANDFNVSFIFSKLGTSPGLSSTSAYWTVPFLSIKNADRFETPFISRIQSW